MDNSNVPPSPPTVTRSGYTIFIDLQQFLSLAVKVGSMPGGRLIADDWGEGVALGPFMIRPEGGGFPVTYEQVGRMTGLTTSSMAKARETINAAWRLVGERVVREYKP